MFNSSNDKPVISSTVATLVNMALSVLNRYLKGRLDDKPEALEWLLALGAIPQDVVNLLSDDILNDGDQLRAYAHQLISSSALQMLLFDRIEFFAEQVESRGDNKARSLAELIRWAKETLFVTGEVLTDINPDNKSQLIDTLQDRIVDDNLINVWVFLTQNILEESASRPIILSAMTLLADQLDRVGSNLEVNQDVVQLKGIAAKKVAIAAALRKVDQEGDPIFNTDVINGDLSVIGEPAQDKIPASADSLIFRKDAFGKRLGEL